MKVITFGEIMLRLAPHGYDRFVQANDFQATFGGGEANVAVSLAQFGMDAAFVSKLPEHAIGQAAINDLRKYGVDTSMIVRGGERIGIYYLEKGASQRPSRVIYDRAYSAIATAQASDFDWNHIFADASWFHFTGITPALSPDLAKITLTAVKQAKAHGLQVSCDLNYRKKLWTSEAANQTMSKLMPYVDVCIANEEEAESVFGIHAPNSNVVNGVLAQEGYVEVAKQLQTRFDLRYVAITLRESISASDNNWGAMLYDGKQAYVSRRYPVHIVDRVGGGDSFAAGLIYALLNNKSSEEAIAFASAASCLKHSIEGDYNQVSVAEVETLMQGDGSGRVQR